MLNLAYVNYIDDDLLDISFAITNA